MHLELHRQIAGILYTMSQIDPKDMRDVVAEKLKDFNEHSQSVDDRSLNSVCWTVGALGGSMPENAEKSFVVAVIKS